MFKRLSVLTVLVLLGASALLSAPTAYAQRGGFGRGGFGRGGFGRGGFGNGHRGSASVKVFQAQGKFFTPHLRSGLDGSGFNNLNTRARIHPFAGRFSNRFSSVFVHAAPFGFFLTDGFVGVPHFDSSLGFPIPPLAPGINPFFFGFPLESRPVFRTFVDLGAVNPIGPISLDCARNSNVTIINLPANAFRGGHQ